MDDYTPDTQPDGSLTPPPGQPPTAVATSAPLPPRRPDAGTVRRSGLRGLLDSALDGLDTLADRIAGVVGLR
jgi:hypothetical protein